MGEWWQRDDFIWHDISEHIRISVNVTNLCGTGIITNISNATVQLKKIMAWNENNKMFSIWEVTSLLSTTS